MPLCHINGCNHYKIPSSRCCLTFELCYAGKIIINGRRTKALCKATLLRVHIRGTVLLNLYVAHHYALGDVFLLNGL